MVAEPPSPTMIRSRPGVERGRRSARRCRSCVAATGRCRRRRRRGASPEARAISITAVPPRSRHGASTGSPSGPDDHRRCGWRRPALERALAPVGHRRLVALVPEPCSGTARSRRRPRPPMAVPRNLSAAATHSHRPTLRLAPGATMPGPAMDTTEELRRRRRADLARWTRPPRPNWCARPHGAGRAGRRGDRPHREGQPQLNAVIGERFERARQEASQGQVPLPEDPSEACRSCSRT